MSHPKGVIAAGHEQTVRAAEEILTDGGNAFDAVVAAHFAACVAEPVLTSLAGGGFLLAQTADRSQTLYDFFAHTPRNKRHPEETEFYPITADFGETQQEFHIGMGSVATPGTVRGLFAIHRDLCTFPIRRLIEPAVEMAREGVITNHVQAYVLEIVKAIYQAHPETLKAYGRSDGSNRLIREGDPLWQPDLADCLEVLAAEGEDFFYKGEIAQKVVDISRDNGGHITEDDFIHYNVYRREPLVMPWKNAELLINPGPSSGGTLIAFALGLLEKSGLDGLAFGSAAQIRTLARAQQLTDIARLDFLLNNGEQAPGGRMLDPHYVDSFRRQIKDRVMFNRGTTHISIMDNRGNTASLTTSNGEGCGRLVPGTGIMMNNMLGEEDLHPEGFENWETDRRITSMMAPAILNLPDGSTVALGSGGSNRLRTAILQVILNLTDHKMDLKEAVGSPRIHCEKDFLNVEHGFAASELKPVLAEYRDHKLWSGANLFFGGTHSVRVSGDGVSFEGAGDLRRGGVARIVR